MTAVRPIIPDAAGQLDTAAGTPAGTAPAGTTRPTPGADQAFRLRRTGGLAGRASERTLSLGELPDDDAASWRDLLDGDRLRAIASPGRTIPDAFTYHVACPPDADEVALSEHDIPGTVRALFARTLEE